MSRYMRVGLGLNSTNSGTCGCACRRGDRVITVWTYHDAVREMSVVARIFLCLQQVNEEVWFLEICSKHAKGHGAQTRRS